MTNTIENHGLILSGIQAKTKLDKECFINFCSSDKYERIGKFEPTERYPHGATNHGILTIKYYPERNGWESMIEDHKYYTQNSKHTYQTPRKIFFHQFCDKDGFGHVKLSSNFGTHMQGVITRATRDEYSILMHGDNDHEGIIWVKCNYKKDKNGSITGEVLSCKDHTHDWKLMQTLEFKPIKG